MKRIAIGNDHAGFDLKNIIVNHLKSMNYEVKDFGTYSNERADYPDYAHVVSESVERGDFEFAVLICGSANGISMAANKHQGIRAALCWKPEIAKLSREHNNANILCLPGRFISDEEGITILTNFLETKFEGGRHQNRINKVSICSASAV